MIHMTLNTDQITDPKFAHRIDYDSEQMQTLIESIRSVGLISPISVKRVDFDTFEVVAGHRRFMAINEIGIDTIDVIVREDDNMTSERIKFDENNIRADLSPMEEAIALAQMMCEEKLDTIQLATRIGRPKSWVESRLILLNHDDRIKDAIHEGKLSMGIANELAKITNKDHMHYLLEYAMNSGASLSVIKQWRLQWQADQMREDNDNTALPELPPAGQQIIIQIPCALCTEVIDHTKSIVLRVCKSCDESVRSANNQ